MIWASSSLTRSLRSRTLAEWDDAADPNAPALGCGKLVADALACDLALELGEGQQHVEGEPPHAGRGVEGLGHRDERDLVGIEDLDELGEVGERAGEPVDLVDHHHIDELRADCREEPLQSGPLERSTREAAIVEALLDQVPALVGLALHVSSPRLALRIERVEVLLEAVLGRHT